MFKNYILVALRNLKKQKLTNAGLEFYGHLSISKLKLPLLAALTWSSAVSPGKGQMSFMVVVVTQTWTIKWFFPNDAFCCCLQSLFFLSSTLLNSSGHFPQKKESKTNDWSGWSTNRPVNYAHPPYQQTLCHKLACLVCQQIFARGRCLSTFVFWLIDFFYPIKSHWI